MNTQKSVLALLGAAMGATASTPSFAAYLDDLEVGLVANIQPDTGSPKGSVPRSLTDINGVLYFNATTTTLGTELYKAVAAEPTAANPINIQAGLVKDINGNLVSPGIGIGSTPSGFTQFTAFNGNVFFVANDGVNGQEVWRTDGTEAGTVLAKNVNPGGNSAPRGLVEFNGSLIFSAVDGTNGRELHRINAIGDYQFLGNINDGGGATDNGSNSVSSGSALIPFGDKLVFVATRPDTGSELFSYTDGSLIPFAPIETYPGRDTSKPRNGEAAPEYLTRVGDRLFYTAHGETANGVYSGRELYYLNLGSTTPIQIEINPTVSTDTTTASAFVDAGTSFNPQFTQVGSQLFFIADNGEHPTGIGQELWVVDLTDDTTLQVPRSVTNIDPDGDTNINDIVAYADKAYFSADPEDPRNNVDGPGVDPGSGDTGGQDLYSTDGLTVNKVYDFDTPYAGFYAESIDQMIAYADLLFFVVEFGDRTNEFDEIWVHDAATNTTRTVESGDFDGGFNQPARYNYNITNLTISGGYLYFAMDHPDRGTELYAIHVPVPEPASLALAAAGSVVMLGRRRKAESDTAAA